MSEHNHDHTHNEKELSGKKFFWVTILNAVITIFEIIGGLLSGSLALLSDALHNLSDTIAIILSYIAYRIAKKPNDFRRSYGYKRAEILTAFVNSTVLLVISVFLITEAIKRFQNPENIDGNLMIIVAFIGLVANFISVFLLEKDSHDNLNIKSSYLHLLGDTVSSVGVLLGGIAIKLWNVIWIDPLVTILISLYIMRETWFVIKKTVSILMQSAADLDLVAIKEDIENIDKVINIHHVHTWLNNEKTIHFEAHIDVEDVMLSQLDSVYREIEEVLIHKYGVSHITLQAEVNCCDDKSLVKI